MTGHLVKGRHLWNAKEFQAITVQDDTRKGLDKMSEKLGPNQTSVHVLGAIVKNIMVKKVIYRNDW